jgi:hypothetical protein
VDSTRKTENDMPDGFTPWQPPDDWSLLDGLHVEIHERGRIIDRGRVEVTTEDGRTLWLALDGVSPRRLVEKLPGTYIRIIPAR